MKKLWTVVVIGLAIMTCTALPVMGEENDLHFAFFTPEGEDNIFWGQVLHFMRQAAEDLGIRLTVYDTEGNHVRMVKQVKEAITGQDPPDAIIIINFKQYAARVLEFTEQTRVPTFIINTSFQEHENMGKPREKYRYWIGEMVPDDEQAGYLLAKELIEQARLHHHGDLEIVGIAGNPFGIVQATATIGGHFMEGAWAVVLLYDYLHGKDFAAETLQMRTPMRAITRSNIDAVSPKLSKERLEALNFQNFSRVLNPHLTRYHFDIAELFSENPF